MGLRGSISLLASRGASQIAQKLRHHLLQTAQGPTSRVGRTEGARQQDPCRRRFQQALQDTLKALATQRAAIDSQPTSRKCSPSKADGMDSRIPILRALSSHRKRRLPASPCRTACRASPHSSSSSSAASRPCNQRQAACCGAVHCFVRIPACPAHLSPDPATASRSWSQIAELP